MRSGFHDGGRTTPHIYMDPRAENYRSPPIRYKPWLSHFQLAILALIPPSRLVLTHLHLPALAAQLRRETAIPIGRPGSGHPCNGLTPSLLLSSPAWAAIAAARIVQYVTDPFHRILGGQARDHPSLLRRGPLSTLEAFWATSSSKLRRPTIHSHSVIRARAVSSRSSPRNTRGALSRNSPFHRASLWGLSWYSRQSSARLFTPPISSRTTRALTSGVNCRRVPIGTSSSWTIIVHLFRCPRFGVLYTVLLPTILDSLDFFHHICL